MPELMDRDHACFDGMLSGKVRTWSGVTEPLRNTVRWPLAKTCGNGPDQSARELQPEEARLLDLVWDLQAKGVGER